MMGHREKFTGFDESEYLTRFRKYTSHDKGRSHQCKKTFSRRIRRLTKESLIHTETM